MHQHNFIFYTVVLSSALCVIPFIISIINLKNINKEAYPIFLLLCINVIMEGINYLFAKDGQHNQYLLHYFTVVEFTLISLFYSLFFKQYFKPLLINLLIPVFLLAAYIDSRVNGVYTINNFSAGLESIVIIFYSLSLFYYVLKNLVFENLLATPVFWINTSIMFYFSGNLILFIFSNHIAYKDVNKYMILWAVIHTFFNLLYNIFLSIGFWKTKKA